MGEWNIIPANAKADDEAALLFKDREIKRQCMKNLQLLAQEENPAEPKNRTLNVKWVEHDAPSWYRLRVE